MSVINSISVDCDNNQIIVDSDLVADYVNQLITTFTATVSINCCDDEYTLEIEMGDISNGMLIITPNLFNVTEFYDGIYSITLNATYGNGNTSYGNRCKLVDCNVACQVARYVADNPGTDLHLLYFSLTKADDCACNCEAMCKIWKRMMAALDILECASPTANVYYNYSDCGCS